MFFFCYLENLKILIKGLMSVLCGNNVKFIVDINLENLKGWLIIWEKVVKLIFLCINLSIEKYFGSIDKSLVIWYVCKGDMGGY